MFSMFHKWALEWKDIWDSKLEERTLPRRSVRVYPAFELFVHILGGGQQETCVQVHIGIRVVYTFGRKLYNLLVVDGLTLAAAAELNY